MWLEHKDTQSDGEGEESTPVSALNPMSLPLKELQKLKARFQSEDGALVPLTQEQFVEALSVNQPTTNDAQQSIWRSELRTLFNKIDASCTSKVDWEEFTDYMLLHMPGFSANESACELSPNMQSAADYASGLAGHQDMINSIIVVYDVVDRGERPGGVSTSNGSGSGRRYITGGRDGVVKVWHSNLTLSRAIEVQHRSWVTQVCWMTRSSRLAVASSNFKVFFYDPSFTNQPASHIDHKDGTPLCLGYHESSESDGREKEILMVGDNLGNVTTYPMDDDWKEWVPTQDNESLRFKTKPIRTKFHTDWVTKVGFVPELQAMVTCGLDGLINLCDIHSNHRKEGKDPIRLHKKGVHTWCWCRSYKFFASGGLDRNIIIWNPYTQKSMNTLNGHNATVLDVVVNEDQHQLISMSTDKVVKVWDLRNYRCVQTFTDKTDYTPEDRLTCMAFDTEGPSLVLCSNNLNVLPVNVQIETSRTHLAPIVGALYNDDFHQIVSGDTSGTIYVWDVRTGNLEFEFRRAHGEHRLTSMSFDESKRRLYTGGEDGNVKLWNFSSGGAALRTYVTKTAAEIVSILWAREGPNTFVVGLALERIYIWPDSQKQIVEPKHILEDRSGCGHIDDISCIRCLSSGHLVTGGDDGFIVFWKIQDASTSSSSGKTKLFDPALAETTEQALKKTIISQTCHIFKNQQSTIFGAALETTETDGQADAQSFLGGVNATGVAVAAVQHMIYLEQKACLLTSHADKIIRVWAANKTKPEFLHRLALLCHRDDLTDRSIEDISDIADLLAGKVSHSARSGQEGGDFVNGQLAAVTALYATSDASKLFTGDAEGFVKLWDLAPLNPQDSKMCRSLLRLEQFRPHRQAVEHIQFFELYSYSVVMSASLDFTIAISTLQGDRIGTFGSHAKQWRLSDGISAWSSNPPELSENRGDAGDEDGWTSPPRRHQGPRAGQPPGSAPSGGGGRNQRNNKANSGSRQASTQTVYHGQGIYKNLGAVERLKPDLTIAEKEKQRLLKPSLKFDH